MPLTFGKTQLNEINNNKWIVTKKTGLESNYGDVIIIENKADFDINIQIIDIEGKDQLKDNALNAALKETEISRSLTELNFTIPKTKHNWFSLGGNTLLMEQDNYWNLTNNFRSYYISKTGFQVSNDINKSYADIIWQIVFNQTLYDSKENIWNWSFANNSNYANLTGISILQNESIEWIANFFLDDNSDFITITLTTNDTTKNYNQRFIHDAINISNDNQNDVFSIEGNVLNIAESQDVNFSLTSEYQIIDRGTHEYIELTYSLITDAIINFNNGIITLFSDLKTLILNWVDPHLTVVPIIHFEFDEFTATQTTFEDIGIGFINVSGEAALNMFITFTLERIGAGAASDTVVRIILDDSEVIGNITRTLSSASEIGSIFLMANHSNLTMGLHNFTFQIARGGTKDTLIRNITFVSNQFQINQTRLFFQRDFVENVILNSSIIKVMSGTFNSSSGGHVLALFNAGITDDSDAGDDNIQLLIEFNHVNSSLMEALLSSADKKIVIGNSWMFEDVQEGLNDYVVYGRAELAGQGGSVLYSHLFMVELNSSEIDVRHSFATLNFSTASTTFVNFLNLSINISTADNDLYVFSASQTRTSGGVARFPEIFYTLDNQINSTIFSREFTGESDKGTIFLSDLFANLTSGIHNISYFARSNNAATTVILDNFSTILLEASEIEAEIIIADEFPNCELILPLDNTITNETLVTFTINSTDDNELRNISLYHNGSSVFAQNDTQILSGASALSFFNQTINFNSTIIWNALIFDSANQSEFCNGNFTLTINQTFPIVVLPVIINISLVNPANNSVITENLVSFGFFTNASFFAGLFIDDILNQTITTTIGSNGFPSAVTFNQNGSHVWRVNDSEFHNFEINLTTGVQEDALQINQCPTTIANSLNLGWLIGLTVFFLAMGFILNIGFVGFFGAIMILVLSWIISGCFAIFGFVLGLIGVVLLIYFAVTGLGIVSRAQ